MVRPLSPRYCCLFVVSIHCQDYMIDGPRMLIRGVWVFVLLDDTLCASQWLYGKLTRAKFGSQ